MTALYYIAAAGQALLAGMTIYGMAMGWSSPVVAIIPAVFCSLSAVLLLWKAQRK